MIINSLDNKRIKEVVKLKNKKYQKENNLFLVDTLNLINEAYELGLLKELYVLEGFSCDIDVPIYEVSSKVMDKIKQVESTKVVGVVKIVENKEILGDKILLLDNVSDPGNLGTIIRSSLAFNIDTIVLSLNTVNLYNEKTIRASEGAIFKINIVIMDLVSAIKIIEDRNIPIYKTDVKEGTLVKDINKDKYAVIIGNEASGISDRIKDLVQESIHIKMNNKQESLNVAIATSIILYELDN